MSRPDKTCLAIAATALMTLGTTSMATAQPRPQPKPKPVTTKKLNILPGYTMKLKVYQQKPRKTNAAATSGQSSQNAQLTAKRSQQGRRLQRRRQLGQAVNLDWMQLNQPATAQERGNPAMAPVVRLKDAVQSAEPKSGLWARFKRAVLRRPN